MTKTSILDSREEIAKLDKSNMLGSIESLADQIKHAREETKKIRFTAGEEIRNVVLAGMGGSALGPDVVKHLYKEKFKVPYDFVNSYSLPGYVDQNTLVVLSSYSGTTEEVLSCAQEAQTRKAQIMIMTGGGKLAELAKKNSYSAYIIDPKHNPSNQPRMAIGYTIVGTIGLLAAAKIISLSDSEIEETMTTILHTDERCRVEVGQDSNPSKALAYTMIDRKPVLVGSEFLSGAIHVSNNQFNENAKIFVDYKVVPEINHHLLEGLKYPSSNSSTQVFVFINSKLYHPRNQARMKLTREAVDKAHIDTTAIDLEQTSKLTQVFESITTFAYANFYTAMLEGIDPSPIPTVDWFKKELKKLN